MKGEIDLLKKSSYHYDLPEELIAQYPLSKRSSSRLLVLNKEKGQVEHSHFTSIVDYLQKGDVLVVNSTKVIPARLIGTKKTGAKIEVFLLNHVVNDTWRCLVKPGRKCPVGTIIKVNDNFSGIVMDMASEGSRLVKFSYEGNFWSALSEAGHIPLPPYIKREAEEADSSNYQTIYAKIKGSVAAPTAGLHFTDEILNKIRNKGVEITEVLLHVGLGTFRPVKAENIEDHKMHSEYCSISKESADLINKAKAEGRRVIAVGTTSTRTLESFAKNNRVDSGDLWTSIFIYPGKEFQIIDAMITNFHMPESTLIMMISAFAGYENIMKTYQIAVEERYRFFSYGDAMLII
ncbi:tRNA preQ1(34) S-adenosylmethionine ribosyltransferase-isomerase QueA [bacterium]|nr:tRNA preQ1(34) S-adenosylmethionine ribosyltransferase-isomerase QueA [bacterium]